jgi:hypothetical protein
LDRRSAVGSGSVSTLAPILGAEGEKQAEKGAGAGGSRLDRFDSDTAVAILLAVAAVIAALIGARAAIVGDEGSDTWHTSVRQDVKRGAGINEDAAYLYSAQASQAFEIADAAIRAEENARAVRSARPSARPLLAAEAAAQGEVARNLLSGSDLADTPGEATTLDGSDLAAALARQRARFPDLRDLDPDETEERGSDLNRQSALLVATTIPVAFAFLLGALGEGFPRRRRVFVPAGFAFAALGLLLAVIVEVTT